MTKDRYVCMYVNRHDEKSTWRMVREWDKCDDLNGHRMRFKDKPVGNWIFVRMEDAFRDVID